jgi:hypothetical protein
MRVRQTKEGELTDDQVEQLTVGDRIKRGALTGTVHTIGPVGGLGKRAKQANQRLLISLLQHEQRRLRH